MKYVSRRYLREKWVKLKWDMEMVVGVYADGSDNVAVEAKRVKDEVCQFMDAIQQEISKSNDD